MALPKSLEREHGYVQAYSGQGYYGTALLDSAEQTPELIWPLATYVYDRMRRTDSQVASSLRALTLPLRRARWSIDPNGADDRIVQHISEDVGLPIRGQVQTVRPGRTRDRFSFGEHLRLALLDLPFGHMPFEQVYRIDGEGASALARLRKLAPRFPATIADIKTARDGGLESIVQHGDGLRGVEIGVDRLVMYTNDREGGWLGTSIVRPAYSDWLLKERFKRVNAISGERAGAGTPVYEGAPNEQDLSAGLAQATRIRAGEQAGAAIGHGASLRIRGVEGTLPNLIESIKYHDEQIARNVLAMFLTLGSSATGSRAVGDTFMDFFHMVIDSVGAQIADTFNQHVIEDLVDINYGEGERAPLLVVEPAEQTAELTPAELRDLVAAQVLTADEGLEVATRQRYRLPAADKPRPALVPVVARARASRTRRVAAANGPADDQPALPLGDLPEPFADLYAKRTDLTSTALEELAPLLTAWAGTLDLSKAIDLALIRPGTGAVAATLDPAEVAIAALIEAEMLAVTAQVDAVTDAVLASMETAWATGQAEAATLLSVGELAIDYQIVFDEALAAAADVDELLERTDGWLAEHVGAASRSAAQAVTDALSDTTVTRAELIGAVRDDVADLDAARTLYDYALSAALGEGARRRYETEGVAEADFLTAADERVDGVCIDAAAGNPWPLADLPTVPQHIGCRCVAAPSTDAIRELLGGGA